MPSAREAREWAAGGGLHGIGDTLFTPFCGRGGEHIDWGAYRSLVRYCVGDLHHDMLWLTSGVAEWWSLTLDERKQLLEIAVDEARSVAPRTVIQACTSAASVKDCVELTLHAQENGADICFLQTPPIEVHGGEGVLRFFEYVADRTDIALGMFNSPSSGYVLTAEEMAAIHHRIPAVVAVKEGVQDSISLTPALHALAPDLVIWECDLIVYAAGWLQQGIVGPAQLGTSAYLFETPDDLVYTRYWQLIWEGALAEAATFAKESGLDARSAGMGSWLVRYPGRPDYFTHWGEAFKYAASVIGLPVGDFPHSRPPQGLLPEEAKAQIRRTLEQVGMAGKARLALSATGS
ncbi:MAG TPA: dihydrodipicolinate synthase family protein [Acidimicrobiales bacterium]|nr:dihydrodipicolinate synthase family protein [Acidimicrobiales bacterium]